MNVFYSLVLFAANLAVIWRLFRMEYIGRWHSIEGTYIGLARVLRERPFDLAWFWQWNQGMPFQNTYVPGLPAMAALTSYITGMSPAHAFHVVTALFYCLGPVSVFWMARQISGRVHTSFLAAGAYSFLSPSVLLIPGVKLDIGGWFNARRMHTTIQYGESTHLVSLTFLPLALLFFHRYFESRRPGDALAAGFFSIATVITNAFGAVSLAFGLICLLAARRADFIPKTARAIAIGVVAYIVISPLIPPSLLATVNRNNALPVEERTRQSIAVAIVAIVFSFTVWLTRRSQREDLRFYLPFAVLLTAVPVLGTRFALPALPQPHRYHIEMEMALCLVAATLVGAAMERLTRRSLWLAAPVMVLLLVAGGLQMRQYRRFARDLIQPADPVQSVVYRNAKMLTDAAPGERVMATSSVGFWFTAFTDADQLFGGHYPFMLNDIDFMAQYVIGAGFPDWRDSLVRVLWLKSMGVHAVSVAGPTSEENYKDFQRNFTVFDGVLPVAAQDRGDTIYRVPQRTPGLAHVVTEMALIVRRPINGIDTAEIERFVAALDDASLPAATMQRIDSSHLRIETTLGPGQVIALQTNYHPGWHAVAAGKLAELAPDGIGMMVIRPACSGGCVVTMEFDGGTEWKIARVLSALTMLGVAAWYVRQRRVKRPA